MKPNQTLIKAEQSIIGTHATLTSISLTVKSGTLYPEWEKIGKTLQGIGRAMPWWVGDWIGFGETAYGEKYSQAIEEYKLDYDTLATYVSVCEKIDITRRRVKLSFTVHREVAKLEPKEQNKWLDKAEKEGWSSRELREEIRKSAIKGKLDLKIEGKYRTIVIDPPWPMEKIDRDISKDPEYLDYPTMPVTDIAAIPIKEHAYEDGCHIYLWTTHRFLPDAFKVMEAWGVDYECTLTWDKGKGMTPFSWMYSTEFVLFGRIGTLPVIKKGEKTLFKGDRREHSRKPVEFYDLVKLVSPEPRLNMFTRETIKGFDSHGNETKKFD